MQPTNVMRYFSGILIAAIGFCCPACAQKCARTLPLSEALGRAKLLDGQVICVRALVRPLPPEDRSSPDLYTYEAVADAPAAFGESAGRAGLLDWDPSLGVNKSLYKPESYELIESAARKCEAVAERAELETVFKAAIFYKRDLIERAYEALPPGVREDAPRRRHYDTELVILEVLNATAVCGK